MRMLDLFSGLGGASASFRAAGWEIVTVDIDPRFKPNIVADLLTWQPNKTDLGFFDLIWASPPCTYFSRYIQRGVFKNEPVPSLDLVESSRRIIKLFQPTYWVIENVRGSVPFIGPGFRSYGPFYLWGNFPDLPVSSSRYKFNKGTCQSGCQADRAARRALIPFELSHALRRTIELQINFIDYVTNTTVILIESIKSCSCFLG